MSPVGDNAEARSPVPGQAGAKCRGSRPARCRRETGDRRSARDQCRRCWRAGRAARPGRGSCRDTGSSIHAPGAVPRHPLVLRGGDRPGSHLDAGPQPTPTMRVAHVTPPGSPCPVIIGPIVIPRAPPAGRQPASSCSSPTSRQPRPSSPSGALKCAGPGAEPARWRQIRLLHDLDGNN